MLPRGRTLAARPAGWDAVAGARLVAQSARLRQAEDAPSGGILLRLLPDPIIRLLHVSHHRAESVEQPWRGRVALAPWVAVCLRTCESHCSPGAGGILHGAVESNSVNGDPVRVRVPEKFSWVRDRHAVDRLGR